MPIDEVTNLINQLDISGKHAEEIINIYFECYSDTWIYEDFLRDEVRRLDKDKHREIIEELENIDDVVLFKGDDYALITNYQTLINMNTIGDCLPEHSF